MPLCNISTAFITQDIFPDRATERKILSLCIKCSSTGCEWTGELREKEVIFNYSQLLTYSFITFTNTNVTIFLLLYLNYQILLFLHNQICVLTFFTITFLLLDLHQNLDLCVIFSNTHHVMFPRVFGFCHFISHAYICTCLGQLVKETLSSQG